MNPSLPRAQPCPDTPEAIDRRVNQSLFYRPLLAFCILGVTFVCGLALATSNDLVGSTIPILGAVAVLTLLCALMVVRGWTWWAFSAIGVAFLCMATLRPLLMYGSAVTTMDSQTEVFVLFSWFPGSLNGLLWNGLNALTSPSRFLVQLLDTGSLVVIGAVLVLLVIRAHPIVPTARCKVSFLLLGTIVGCYLLLTPRLLPVNNGTGEWLVAAAFFAGAVFAALAAVALWWGRPIFAFVFLVVSLCVGQLVPSWVYGFVESFPTSTWFPVLRTVEYAELCEYMTSGACANGITLSLANEVSLTASLVLAVLLLSQRAWSTALHGPLAE